MSNQSGAQNVPGDSIAMNTKNKDKAPMTSEGDRTSATETMKMLPGNYIKVVQNLTTMMQSLQDQMNDQKFTNDRLMSVIGKLQSERSALPPPVPTLDASPITLSSLNISSSSLVQILGGNQDYLPISGVVLTNSVVTTLSHDALAPFR
ncbi:hypothetical protein OROGR_005550 [Orobanche gracilis]